MKEQLRFKTDDSKRVVKKKNQQNRIRLLTKLAIVSYFDVAEIQLFVSGNAHFKELAKLDLADIQNAELTNDREQQAWRTNDLSLDNIYEAGQVDLQALLDAKFADAKRDFGFKTKLHFAKHEAADLESRYSTFFGWFPILEQWVNFLKDSRSNFKRTPAQLSEAGRKGKRQPDTQKIQKANEVLKKSTISNPSTQKIRAYLKANDIDCSLSWIKKHRAAITR